MEPNFELNIDDKNIMISAGSRNIGIVEMSSLFDLSTEALRKYEDKGVLKPFRDRNGYRKYLSWDVTKLLMIRQMRQQGFQLNDISALVEDANLNEQIAKIESMKQALIQEIKYKEKLVKWINTQQQEIQACIDLKDNCKIEHLPEMYCCVYMYDDTLVNKSQEEKDILKEWIRALPFVRVCYIGYYDNVALSCLTINKDEIEEYGLSHLKPDFILPARTYVASNVVANRNSECDTSYQCIQKAIEKSKSFGISSKAPFVIQSLWYVQEKDTFVAYNKAMFALEAKEQSVDTQLG